MKKRYGLKIASLAVALLGIVSTSFALFKQKSEANIAVTSGKIKVSATLDSLKTFSADPTLTEGDVVPGGDNLGENSGTYYYKELLGGYFSNGGEATIENGELKLKDITPGDKASVKLTITNESSVSFKYRVVFESANESIDSLRLFSTLKFKAFDTELTGCVRYATEWEKFTSLDNKISTDIDVVFPLDATFYQATSCAVKFTVEAVQANAITVNEDPQYVEFDSKEVEKEGDSFKDFVIGDENVNVELDLNNNTIKAVKEGGEKTAIEEGEVLTLKVEDASAGNISVESGFGTKGFEIGLYNSNGEKIVSTEEDIVLNINVGLDKVINKVYHNGVEVDPSKYSYDAVSGYLTILTNSFSPFVIVLKTCNHTEDYNNHKAATCAECLATRNTLVEEGASAKLEQSSTGYFTFSWNGAPVTGFEWVEAVNDTVIFTTYTGSAQKTGGFKTLTLEAGKKFCAHIKVTNTGDSTLEFEAKLDTLSIDPEVLKYLSIENSETANAMIYEPRMEVLEPGVSEIVRIYVNVSSELPAELAGTEISNLPVLVNAHWKHVLSLVSQTETTSTYKCSKCNSTNTVSRLSTVTKTGNISCTVKTSDIGYYNNLMIEDDELINLDSNTLRFIPKSQLMGNYTIGTFSLVKGKAYESCIILKNTGDSTIKIDSIEANDILLNGVDISKYISLELSTKKYSPEQIDNVMQAGESREIKLYFTVSSELPEEYVNLLVDNVSINVELSEVK